MPPSPFIRDPYFASDSRRWTPALFGSSYLDKNPDCSAQRMSNAYVKTLHHISLDEKTTERRRLKADHLLGLYRESDRVKSRLKELWDAEQSRRGASPLIINHSTVGFLSAGNLETHGSLGVEIRKRLRDDGGEGLYSEDDEEAVDRDNTQGRSKKPKSVSFLEAFIRKYKAMDDSSMWKLSTGKVVEKCIYEGVVSSSSVEGLAHMWIISSKDPWMMNLFTEDEREEIHSSRVVQKVMVSTQSCWDLLSKFKSVTTFEGLETILFGAIPEIGKHTEWVYNVMRQMRVLLKHPNTPLLSDHGENWYEVNVWGPIIDHLFLLAAENVEVDRKEVACSATTLRLNEGRTRTGKGHYLATGKRSDAIIRATDSHSPLEYGAMEAKPSFAGETSTAFLDDYEKLMTTLSHMLSRLVQSVNPGDVKKLEVIGVILAGLHFQIIRMWTPNGNVYVAKPDDLYKIPTNVQRLKDIIPLLFSIWQMVKTIATCLEAVNNSDRYGSMSLNDFL